MAEATGRPWTVHTEGEGSDAGGSWVSRGNLDEARNRIADEIISTKKAAKQARKDEVPLAFHCGCGIIHLRCVCHRLHRERLRKRWKLC